MADMRLIDAPVGLFYHGKTLCVKTEYFTDGGVDAYIVSSGEYFHGGTQTSEERNSLMVHPVNQRNLRPVGRWVKKKPSDKKIYCSRCGRQNATHSKRPFCSGCGAMMKERKEQ